MRKGARRATERDKQAASGKHGGNRAGGDRARRAKTRGSPAAGKDPARGKGR